MPSAKKEGCSRALPFRCEAARTETPASSPRASALAKHAELFCRPGAARHGAVGETELFMLGHLRAFFGELDPVLGLPRALHKTMRPAPATRRCPDAGPCAADG